MSKTNLMLNRILTKVMKKDLYLDKINHGLDKHQCPKPYGFFLKGILMTEKDVGRRIVVTLSPLNEEPVRDVFFYHGGAYALNIGTGHWPFLTDLVKRAKVRVHVVDYPLIPEHHSGEALEYAFDHYCQEMMLGTKNLVLMGDSAGGGLILSLLMKLREEKQSLPDKAILLSPYLDSFCSDERQVNLEPLDPILSISGLRAAGAVYAGNMDWKDWRVNPIEGEVHGLCPISIYTSDMDILHIDAIRLKEKLDLAGVPCLYNFTPGVIHDWCLFGLLPEAKKAKEDIIDELLTVH